MQSYRLCADCEIVVTSIYEVIYMLKPQYEEIKRGGKDWYKLKWKPIFGHTFNVTILENSVLNVIPKFRYFNFDANNGWNRYYKHRLLSFSIFKIEFLMWIKYDFIVHKNGPSDTTYRRSLDLSHLGDI